MKKIRTWVIVFMVVSTCLSSQILYAQRPHPAGLPEEHARERIREEIETMRMWKMLEVLDMSEEQSDEFLPAWRGMQKAHRSFREKRGELLRELEHVLREEQENKERKIDEIFDELKNEKAKLKEAQDRFRAEAKELLTLEQQAKLLIFEEKFERRMMEMIRKFREKRRFGE